MDSESEAILEGVHPDLAKVMRQAFQTPQAFKVIQGLRTQAAEQQAVNSGHSMTMHSRHLAGGGLGPDGIVRYGDVALACDIVCLVDGGISWTVSDQQGGIYGQAAGQVLAAAKTLGIKVQWGGQVEGAWVDGEPSHFRDWGHFQLDPSAYP